MTRGRCEVYSSVHLQPSASAGHQEMGMRRFRNRVAATLFFISFLAAQGAQNGARRFAVVEAGIPEIQAALKSRNLTSRELVVQYLTRIAIYEDKLHAAITINANAIQEAEALDRERAQGKIRGPLHGIPIALK